MKTFFDGYKGSLKMYNNLLHSFQLSILFLTKIRQKSRNFLIFFRCDKQLFALSDKGEFVEQLLV